MKFICCNIFKFTNESYIDKRAKLVTLDQNQSMAFVSGQVLGKYLLVIKQIIKKVNQVFNISEVEVSHIQTQPDFNTTQNAETSAHTMQMTKNWKIIDNQLQRIGIYIEPATLQEYINGNIKSIQFIFKRIDRYVKMLTFDGSLTEFKSYRKALPKSKISFNHERKINRRGQQIFL